MIIKTDNEMFDQLRSCMGSLDAIRYYLRQQHRGHKAEVAKLKRERDDALSQLKDLNAMKSSDVEDAVYVALRGQLTNPDGFRCYGTVSGRLDANGLTMTRWEADPE